MDAMDISAATSAGDNKQHFYAKTRNGLKRLHLRKTAVQPPTMQSEDKRGPKKIAGEWEQSKVWPSSKRKKTTSEAAQQVQRETNDSGNTLTFTCSQCTDNMEYVPKDLVRHFEEKHKGNLPVFSCRACTFNTHEFSYLQVHLLSHKDTFSSCSICNDNIQRTWPEFSAHLTLCHCQNGKYTCEVCQRFSTGDVVVFLEHVHVHNLGLEGANDDLKLHKKDNNQLGPKAKATTHALRCQHCGYEASQKWLITKHINTVHVCQNGNRRKRKKEEVHSIAKKPNDPIPKMKPRLTRSAVREMCWLAQDCLSLPGREFLDKYCHLSDPQTTLEETQQFLMKSVTGETNDQKWTKALKTVLSNVPQDLNLHPKSENGIMSNSSDLTVLTVKNKITVAQNGAPYPKRVKTVMTTDKETVFPESAADDGRRMTDQNGCQSNLNEHVNCPQSETKYHNDVLVSSQSEASECTQMQENRENQELQTDKEMVENGKKHQEPLHEDVINISSELKVSHESAEQTCVHKVLRKYKRRIRGRKRKMTSKKVDKSSLGIPLKIVLKKNPVKGKQWVSQSSLSPTGRAPVDDGHDTEKTTLVTEVQQKKWTKASKMEEELVPKGDLEDVQETQADSEKPQQVSEETELDKRSVVKKGFSDSRPVASTDIEMCNMNGVLQASGGGIGFLGSDDKSSASYTKSASVSQPVISPQDKVHLEDSSLALSLETSVHPVTDGEVPADPGPDLLSSSHPPAGKAIQQESLQASRRRWQPVPKNQERTLKLVAINPSQLVKRPEGDQPVVVLNHPDADIPEVAKIMEVVNRYKGKVQKVMLSYRTLRALTTTNCDNPETNDPADAQTDFDGPGVSSVQERFTLKLKLRRLTRKKYEVVGAVAPGDDDATKFRCWFCGRVFACQETWMVHRQRHLMEWKKPKCENS